ncbi:MAG: integrase [Epsilonproteobacteria bacterium]|nr:MAG: integrase [Campylobacterota bacterium]
MLSDTQIKKLKIKDKDYSISDGQGLQLLIKVSDTKLWEFRYTSPTIVNSSKAFKRRKTSFGTYPQTTLKIARAKRNDFINLINQGIDPLEQKKIDKQEIVIKENSNFKLIADEWLEFESKRTIEATHKRKKATFKNDIYPYFANKSINDITHQDIIEVVKKKSKKGLEGANKLFRNLNTVWKFAITKGLCKSNPFNDLIKDLIIPKNETKHFSKITDIDKLKELVNKIYTYDGHYSTVAMLKFVLHIPLRADNLSNLKWEYIDLDNKTLTIPRALMKAKNKNMPDFKMPLTDTVIKILKEQLELTGYQEFVFLGVGGKPINPVTPNAGLKRMGFIDDKKQTLHSFRGTFRSLVDTYQKEHNTSFEAKERALDHHERNKVVKAYSHQAEYFEQMKPLMEWWSCFIDELLDEVKGV